MLSKTRAIVLNHTKYGDSSLIVRVFTEKYGRQSFIAHGVRKSKSKYNHYLFEPLALLNVNLYYKENRELQTLKDVEPAAILQQLHFDINRSTIAIFLSEIIHRTLREIEANTSLFNFLFHAIQILDMNVKGTENFHILFLLQYSKFIGIFPKNNLEMNTYRSKGNIQLTNLLDHSLTELAAISLTQANRSELLDLLLAYYQNHLEGMGEIKSLSILRELFD